MTKISQRLLKVALGFGTLFFIVSKLTSKKIEPTVIKRNYMVGDSHAVGIGSRISNLVTDKLIAKGGWFVSSLINALNTYPVTYDVKNVFISIGTNGQFSKNDNLELLIKTLKQKFPNAKLYVFVGSYGWSGSLSKAASYANAQKYYQRFRDLGVTVLNSQLGYHTTDALAHSTNTPEAKKIIAEITNIIKN
jgi:hypothetical protein